MAIGEIMRQRLFNEKSQPKIIKVLDNFLDLINFREYYKLLYKFREFKETIDELDDLIENLNFFIESMLEQTSVEQTNVEETKEET